MTVTGKLEFIDLWQFFDKMPKAIFPPTHPARNSEFNKNKKVLLIFIPMDLFSIIKHLSTPYNHAHFLSLHSPPILYP